MPLTYTKSLTVLMNSKASSFTCSTALKVEEIQFKRLKTVVKSIGASSSILCKIFLSPVKHPVLMNASMKYNWT